MRSTHSSPPPLRALRDGHAADFGEFKSAHCKHVSEKEKNRKTKRLLVHSLGAPSLHAFNAGLDTVSTPSRGKLPVSPQNKATRSFSPFSAVTSCQLALKYSRACLLPCETATLKGVALRSSAPFKTEAVGSPAHRPYDRLPPFLQLGSSPPSRTHSSNLYRDLPGQFLQRPDRMDSNLDILALEQTVRTPFRSGGAKMLDENGKPIFMPGPERIPRTHGRREVYLNNQNIGDIGAKLVGNELKSTTDAQSLWLYGNGITAKGAEELAKGLKANTTLKVLDLHDNKIGNEGARVLAQALKGNTTLQILNICSNGIGPKLPQALEKHPTLKVLCFATVIARPLVKTTLASQHKRSRVCADEQKCGVQVTHDPWTTSHTQMQSKPCKIKEYIFEWNKGSMYGITGTSQLGAPWDRRAAPTLYPGLTPIPNGLSGVSLKQP
eukprot:3518950-Rhodomonas_salina.1